VVRKAIILALIMLFAGAASAAEIYINRSGLIRIDGTMVQGDVEKFERVSRGYPPGTYVSLSGPGGNIGVISSGLGA